MLLFLLYFEFVPVLMYPYFIFYLVIVVSLRNMKNDIYDSQPFKLITVNCNH